MMYDEYCFERWSNDAERIYLSGNFTEEKEKPVKCCGYHCDEEAVIQIDGDWYCADCALEVEKYK